MKRIIAILTALLLCAAVVSCRNKAGTESTVSDPSWNQISEKKQLVVGVYSDRAPLTKAVGNRFEGFDVDLLTQLASRLNVTVEFKAIDGRTAEDALNSGDVDCVCSGLVYTAERNEALSLSEAYLTSRQLFAVTSGSGTENLADLAGKTVGVASGGAADLALQKSETFRAALAEVRQYDEEDGVIRALLDGEIDAAAVNETLIRHYIRKNSDLRTLLNSEGDPDSLGSDNYVLAFRRGSDALLKKVAEAFSTMKRDGLLDELSEKWFSNFLSAAEKEAAELAKAIAAEEAANGAAE